MLRQHARLPSIQYIDDCFNYAPNTGALTWKERPADHFKSDQARNRFLNHYVGKDAGTAMPDGYIVVRVQRIGIQASRIIWVLAYGEWPTMLIDHINHKRADNRLINLREVSYAGNSRNKRLSKLNTSGHIGVTWVPSMGSWKAMIGVGGFQKGLGYFETKMEAEAAYLGAASVLEYHPNHGGK